MRKLTWLVLTALVLAGCASTGDIAGDAEGGEISALGAVGRTVDSGPMYEGSGGAGLRLAILAPENPGAGPDETWLPAYIQGLLNNNFRKYSAITIIDRQNLDKVLAEQNLSMNGNFSDADYIRIGQLTNAQYVLAGALQKLPDGLFALQLAITHLETGVRQASFMENGSLMTLQSGRL
ncbi:MAG: CsgG/HfaB family protein, partial [Spirochaetaceae bacterium]|nr:CsgG/HfaB family protein [Spirochaetaceae bacterium]